MPGVSIPTTLVDDVQMLWEYHDVQHQLAPTEVGIALGSHDLGVATFAAELFNAGMFPLLVVTGANAPTTVDRFPRGEAVHYREHALSLGVPEAAIIVEPRATNTGENLIFSRDLLADVGIVPRTVTLISRPYQQRRAYATCRRIWPEVEVRCAGQRLSVAEYVAAIGDVDRVINMLVGDTQRISVHAERGFAIPQEIPPSVAGAYQRLLRAGYTARLIGPTGQ